MNVLLIISIALHLGFCLLLSIQLTIRKFHSKLHVARLLRLQFHIQGYSFSILYLRSRPHLLQIWCYYAYAYSSRLPLQPITPTQQAPTMNFSVCSVWFSGHKHSSTPLLLFLQIIYDIKKNLATVCSSAWVYRCQFFFCCTCLLPFSEPAIALFTPGICKTRTLDWTARGLDHGL